MCYCFFIITNNVYKDTAKTVNKKKKNEINVNTRKKDVTPYYI